MKPSWRRRNPTLPVSIFLFRVPHRSKVIPDLEGPAFARDRFHVAHQKVGEFDRALTLATVAFRDLPYAYAAEQAVTKFCQGLLDKDVGKHVSMQLRILIGDAMNRM
ncbi:hypothetical protein DPMN_104120 [Dreissena polymorpha]|uniref:Uncharacterized protein n=1 Tax=Dreissena polymorpha TaxID=45954 RepID=A0A9D4HCG3_DREPO|nr:hypothetical protein DPMN_104120 [Dreissena polymorpha]